MRDPRSKTFIPSPVKKRNPKKSQTIVTIKTKAIRLKEARARLAGAQPEANSTEPSAVDEWVDVDMADHCASGPVNMEDIVVDCEPKTRRTVPDQATSLQYQRWLSLLPDLQTAYLQHLPESIGAPMYPHQTFSPLPCSSLHCTGLKTTKVLCLFLDRKFYFNTPLI